MSNPFDEDEGRFADPQHPSLPHAAFTSDRSSPRRYNRIEDDDDDEASEELMMFPQSTQQLPYRQSPNIFARSVASANRNQGIVLGMHQIFNLGKEQLQDLNLHPRVTKASKEG